jgi:DNA-binding MarR family transcriptional regulator
LDDLVEGTLEAVRQCMIALVRHDSPDLNARQLAVFLILYFDDVPQTVGRLAVQLSIATTVASRVIDRLSEFDLVRREDNPSDKRSALIQRTTVGAKLFSDLKSMLATAWVASRQPAAW